MQIYFSIENMISTKEHIAYQKALIRDWISCSINFQFAWLQFSKFLPKSSKTTVPCKIGIRIWDEMKLMLNPSPNSFLWYKFHNFTFYNLYKYFQQCLNLFKWRFLLSILFILLTKRFKYIFFNLHKFPHTSYSHTLLYVFVNQRCYWKLN